MSTSQTREEIESITRSLRPGDVVEATRGPVEVPLDLVRREGTSTDGGRSDE